MYINMYPIGSVLFHIIGFGCHTHTGLDYASKRPCITIQINVPSRFIPNNINRESMIHQLQLRYYGFLLTLKFFYFRQLWYLCYLDIWWNRKIKSRIVFIAKPTISQKTKMKFFANKKLPVQCQFDEKVYPFLYF